MTVSQTPLSVRLAEHVRACRVGDQMVFLDLRSSRYIGIGGPQLPALSALLDGSPSDALSCPPSELSRLHHWIHRLHHQGLLVDGPSTKSGGGSPVAIEPTAGLAPEDEHRTGDPDWRHVVRLWRATLVTTAWLRLFNLAQIVAHVMALRMPPSGQDHADATNAMHEEAARYMRLRPFALSSHDRCLKDSLTLIHFMSARGLAPRWVIGVRTHPFGAHSWVQHGEVVLNDLPERVRKYQPILIV